MIKVVSFDIGGTLVKLNGNCDAYSLKSLTNLLNLPYEKVRSSYKNVFQKTKGTFDDLVSEFCNQMGIEKDQKIIHFFQEKFESEGFSKIDDHVVKLLQTIKEHGYQIILFSNTCNLYSGSENLEVLYPFVDDVFLSYEIGFTKNDDESYRLIEKRLNHEADEFLHIGDNLKSDYYGPIKNGWEAIYYGDDMDNISSIQSLDELLSILNIHTINQNTI